MNDTDVAVRDTAAWKEQCRATRRSTARERRRAVLESLALVVTVALLIAAPLVSRPHAPAVVETTEIRTEAGDTLWGLAVDHPIDGLTTAQAVEVIARINGLQSARVGAGRTLSIPAAASNLEVASK